MYFDHCFKDLDTFQSGQSSCPITINAHKTELACIAIDQKGEKVATASKKVLIAVV